MADAPPRQRDRIDIEPRYSAADAIRLNQMFRGSDSASLLDAVLRERLIGDVALVSSFGTESAVLLHLVAQVNPATPLLFLDTGKHFPETLAYRDALVARFGLTGLINLVPDPAEIAARDSSGERWSYDPDGCCDLRKVLPLERALTPFDASLTGRKAFQAETRANLPRFELDGGTGRLKVNPLIDWRREDIAAYFAAHELPRHPLEADGYPSIGCAPCTARVGAGEDPRSGRWQGWDKVECGIHLPGNAPDDPANGSAR